MTKFILSAVVASLTFGVAVAGPGGKGNSNGGNHSNPSPSMGSKQSSFNKHSTSNFHQTFAKSFSHGFFYEGKNHNHWTYSCYSSKFGCQCYWCPNTCCYYYWCQPSNCFYPISYISYAPPVQVQVQVSAPVTVAAPLVQTQTQTQTQTQAAGGPPAGIPPLPQ